jgi:hypothetical protein
MSKAATKTNNDLNTIEKKIQLRLNSLPTKDLIYILDAFAGEGLLWKEVQKRTNKQIKILSIDEKEYRKISLKGDNRKFLKSIDLNYFDIIDLDAYGSPSNQLMILKEKNYKGIVHCTFIQTMMGRISNDVLFSLGITKTMINKCPTLFSKNGLSKMLEFISLHFKVSKVNIFSKNNKHYFYFVIN